MNIGVLRERSKHDRRVAITPPVARQLIALGNTVWVEQGAGEGAMFRDEDYVRAGAEVAYTPAEVIRRCEVVTKMSVPTLEELDLAPRGLAMLAFYHLAVADRAIFHRLIEREVTAIGDEIIEEEAGRLPVLAAVSEIAGQMTISLASHLLRSSAGGRGILLGGSPGIPPAQVVILGAGVVGSWAARAAVAAGAQVTALDTDTEKLRRLMKHVPNVATSLADPEAVGRAVAGADVLIGAVLVAGAKTPHVVTRAMVESMQPGSVIIDVAIDQGGCVETIRPTTMAEPVFTYHGVVHYGVPNLTADIGRSTSVAVAQALLPYLGRIAELGVEGALRSIPDLARGVYTHRGACVHERLARAWKQPWVPLLELLGGSSAQPMMH